MTALTRIHPKWARAYETPRDVPVLLAANGWLRPIPSGPPRPTWAHRVTDPGARM